MKRELLRPRLVGIIALFAFAILTLGDVSPKSVRAAQGIDSADPMTVDLHDDLSDPDAMERFELLEALQDAKPAIPVSPSLLLPGIESVYPTDVMEYDVESGEEQEVLSTPDERGGAVLFSAPFFGDTPAASPPEGSEDGADLPSLASSPTPPSPNANTVTYPWRTTVKLLMRFNVAGTNYYYVCSGATINSFLVYTAGHCVYNHDPDGDNNTSDARWADEVWIWPGQTDRVYSDEPPIDADWPYGVAKATLSRSYTGWTQSANPDYDFGWITLDRRLGDRVGWMGATSDTATSVNFNGYPSETPDAPANEVYQYPGHDNGNVRAFTSNRVQMDAYTYGGQGGGPVWRDDESSGDPQIVGVNSTSNRAGYAEATRVTSDVISKTNTFVSEDNSLRPPVDRPELIEYTISTTAKDLLTNSVQAGNSIQVEYNAFNIGWAKTIADIDFYLSTNDFISTSDTLIGTRSHPLGPNTYVNTSTSLTVPPSVTPGTYFVGWLLSSSETEYNVHDNAVVIGPEKLAVESAYSLDVDSSGASDISVNSNATVTENEPLSTHRLTVNSLGASGVEISATPFPSLYGGTTDYEADISVGAEIVLTAPDTADGASFSGWSGCNSTGGDGWTSCNLKMNGDKTVTANYSTEPTYELTVNSSGVENAPIVASPEQYGGTTSYIKPFIPEDQYITLTAQETVGSASFWGWSRCSPLFGGITLGRDCTVRMSDHRQVTAVYSGGPASYYNLTVRSSGASDISIEADPADYGGTTNYTKWSIPAGTPITLLAPDTADGVRFSSWSGCSETLGEFCSVEMTGDRTVSVTFVPEAPVCGAEALFSGRSDAEPSLELLRDVRDHAKVDAPAGEWLSETYYEHSAEVVRRLRDQPLLRLHAMITFMQVRKDLTAFVSGQRPSLDWGERFWLRSFARSLRRGASPELASDLDTFLDLDWDSQLEGDSDR